MITTTPRSTLFPYTTLFRSVTTDTEFTTGNTDDDLVFEYVRRCSAGGAALRIVTLVGPDDFTRGRDRKSTRLNSSHSQISYAVFCLKKKRTPMASNSKEPPA